MQPEFHSPRAYIESASPTSSRKSSLDAVSVAVASSGSRNRAVPRRRRIMYSVRNVGILTASRIGILIFIQSDIGIDILSPSSSSVGVQDGSEHGMGMLVVRDQTCFSRESDHIKFFALKPEYATYIPFTAEQDPSDPYNDAQFSAKPRAHRYRPGAHDGWMQCAKALREHDDIVVNAWKEGIDTLLVFVCRSYAISIFCVRKLTVSAGRFVLCRAYCIPHRVLYESSTRSFRRDDSVAAAARGTDCQLST